MNLKESHNHLHLFDNNKLHCVIKVMSPAVESSLSATLLATGESLLSNWLSSWCRVVEVRKLFSSSQSWFKLFNAAVCVNQLVLLLLLEFTAPLI